jgi:LCP family protein required for cell wall assembly
MVPHTINFMTGAESPHEPSPSIHESPKEGQGRRKKALFLLLVIFVCGIGWWYVHAGGSIDPIRARVTLEPKKPKNLLKKISYIAFGKSDDEGTSLAGYKNDRINVLLLGMGGPGHDGPFLTDTIMIASIQPSTKQVALISIPRDLGISMPGYGYQKINHANAYGELKQPDWGAAYTTELISKTFAIDIPYYIRLDFKAFQEIIDEVGGVTVTVDRSFTDPMFPAPNSEFQTVTFASGEQTMNGETALTYARSRHGDNGEGSDFARARRQQKNLLALKSKLADLGLYANPIRVNSIINSVESHLTTNMEFDELISLARLGKTLDTSHIISLVLDSSPNGYLKNSFTPGGAFILYPTTGNFTAISSALQTIFTNRPTQTTALATSNTSTTPTQTEIAQKKNSDTPTIEIQNGTWNAGLAARVRRRLEFRDIIIENVNNAGEKPINESAIYLLRKNASPAILETLIDELKIPTKQTIPTNIHPATSTDVLIMLGDDFID